MLSHLPMTLAGSEEGIMVVGILGSIGFLIFLVHSIRAASETKAREMTKREIAAYVAEGSISPDDAARILTAGENPVAKSIADAVAWGTIKPEKAESLLRQAQAGAGGGKA